MAVSSTTCGSRGSVRFSLTATTCGSALNRVCGRLIARAASRLRGRLPAALGGSMHLAERRSAPSLPSNSNPHAGGSRSCLAARRLSRVSLPTTTQSPRHARRRRSCPHRRHRRRRCARPESGYADAAARPRPGIADFDVTPHEGDGEDAFGEQRPPSGRVAGRKGEQRRGERRGGRGDGAGGGSSGGGVSGSWREAPDVHQPGDQRSRSAPTAGAGTADDAAGRAEEEELLRRLIARARVARLPRCMRVS